jgi:hypothetical protein
MAKRSKKSGCKNPDRTIVLYHRDNLQTSKSKRLKGRRAETREWSNIVRLISNQTREDRAVHILRNSMTGYAAGLCGWIAGRATWGCFAPFLFDSWW